MKKINPFLLTDAYKLGHVFQYPENTTKVYTNFTPRKSRLTDVDYTVFFGLQAFIKEYIIDRFNDNFFSLTEEEAVSSYKEVVESMLGPDGLPKYEHIRSLHKLGYMPIRIKALEEGTLVPMRVPALTIVNTKDEFYWLPNFLESLLSAQLWQSCTSATIAFEYKKLLTKFAVETSDNVDFVNWQGHDFSFRGMSSVESACLSGAGHLTSFTGTDTVPSLNFLVQYYNARFSDLIGGSVPATEHSVMCAGEKDSELETFKRLITKVYPKGIVSIVSDTWNLWTVLTTYITELKDIIVNREGKVVFRPDSGNPVDIIAGKFFPEFSGFVVAEEYFKFNMNGNKIFKVDGKYYQVQVHGGTEFRFLDYTRTPEDKGVIELLYEVFGGNVNSKGYIELPSYVGAIYGDSITIARAKEICERLKAKKFASTNIVFGIGSYTYQYNTRDTFGWAMKATYVEVAESYLATPESTEYSTNYVGREIFKDPITDDGTKKSAKGLLRVEYNTTDKRYELIDQCSWEEESSGALKIVFEDGKLVKETSLQEVRELLASNM